MKKNLMRIYQESRDDLEPLLPYEWQFKMELLKRARKPPANELFWSFAGDVYRELTQARIRGSYFVEEIRVYGIPHWSVRFQALDGCAYTEKYCESEEQANQIRDELNGE